MIRHPELDLMEVSRVLHAVLNLFLVCVCGKCVVIDHDNLHPPQTRAQLSSSQILWQQVDVELLRCAPLVVVNYRNHDPGRILARLEVTDPRGLLVHNSCNRSAVYGLKGDVGARRQVADPQHLDLYLALLLACDDLESAKLHDGRVPDERGIRDVPERRVLELDLHRHRGQQRHGVFVGVEQPSHGGRRGHPRYLSRGLVGEGRRDGLVSPRVCGTGCRRGACGGGRACVGGRRGARRRSRRRLTGSLRNLRR
mmetsp:Transcript_60496/g.169547  ORF Transcript_60496/g.169547 Transcript_60496/m.169547 type:complete len:254 (+) Transcript_60496:1061-1822(+)